MISLEEARLIVTRTDESKMSGIMETETEYVFCLGNGNEGYTTVNKENGRIGFMWIWEAFDLANSEKIDKIVEYK